MVKRGQIWWAELPEPQASEPGYRRPVLIIQANEFNNSRICTVIVTAITSNLRLAEAPGNVLLPRAQSSLPKDSVINVSQILTLDRSFLTEQINALSTSVMRQTDEGLRLVLGL
jgi:mRNA interferase MazF